MNFDWRAHSNHLKKKKKTRTILDTWCGSQVIYYFMSGAKSFAGGHPWHPPARPAVANVPAVFHQNTSQFQPTGTAQHCFTIVLPFSFQSETLTHVVNLTLWPSFILWGPRMRPGHTDQLSDAVANGLNKRVYLIYQRSRKGPKQSILRDT